MMEEGRGRRNPGNEVRSRADTSISRKCLLTGHADGKTRARQFLR